MIQIEEPPTVRGCASCSSPLSWLWSPIRQAWICVVPLDARRFELHGCRHAQDPVTWRQLPHRSEPPPEYVQARKNITERTRT